MSRKRETRQAAKTKKPIFKRPWFVILVLLVAIMAFAPNGNKRTGNKASTDQVVAAPTKAPVPTDAPTPEPTETPTEAPTLAPTEEPTATPIVIAYDDLRTVFAGLTYDTTPADIENAIAQYGLEYTNNKYNGYFCYRLAYDSEVALQKYGKDGDNLEIAFDSKNEGRFMYAKYLDNSAFVQAVLFNYGHWFNLHGKEPNSATSGYYSVKPGGSYDRCESAEEAIRMIYEKARK